MGHVQGDGAVAHLSELGPGALGVGQGILVDGVTGVRFLQDPLPREDLTGVV